ncbi:hypothetical protein GQ600_16856 [Phytophthora cactorum]|nr:hypothetical protein GQ600_16856 [Phytophthora cactorum]
MTIRAGMLTLLGLQLPKIILSWPMGVQLIGNVYLQATLNGTVDVGHLELFMWIKQQPGIVPEILRINLDCTYLNGHFEAFKWLIQHSPTKCLVIHTDTQAASAGRLAIVATSL